MNCQSKKIICGAVLCLLCIFMLISCGKSITVDSDLPTDNSEKLTENYESERNSETETSEESSSEKTTTKRSLQAKIESVTLKNKKPITSDNAYKQTDKQKEEEKEQQTNDYNDYQDDIKPSKPVRPSESKPSLVPPASLPSTEDGTGENTSDDVTGTQPEPQPPYKYPNIPVTKDYAGFGYTKNEKWIADDNNFYIDGKKVEFYKGIDVSIFQREPDKTDVGIDFKAVKNSGVDFVIVRLGARSQSTTETWIDRYFVSNVKQAYAAGLKVGVYFYSQAVTETEAIEEAKICLEAIKDTGCKIEYPVIMDVEGDNTRLGKISKAQRTANIKAFCETIIDGGYYPMVYANQVWMDEKIDMSQIDYDIWMACYKDPKCVKTVFGVDIPFTMWQYGGRNVPGIRTGAVDVNISLVNYPDFLKKHGWNNL